MAVTRRQSANDLHDTTPPSSATLSATPNEGNLLVATAFARTGTSIGSISGTGWTVRVDRDTEFADLRYRRSLKIWTKIAGASEPTNVQVSDTSNLLVVEEFEGDGKVLSDSFTDASGTDLTVHVPEVGGSWVEHPSYTAGQGEISDANRVRSDNTNTVVLYNEAEPVSTDYDVEFTVAQISDAGISGIVARCDTAVDTYYVIRYNTSGAGAWQLQARVAGVTTELGSWTDTIGSGSSRSGVFELRGSELKVYIEGIERISVSDSTISAKGRVGVWLGGGAGNTTRIHVDSITVTDAVAEEFTFLEAASNDNGATDNATSIPVGTTGSTEGDVFVWAVACARLNNLPEPDFGFSSLTLGDELRATENGTARYIESAYTESSDIGTKTSTAGSAANANTGLSAAILVFATGVAGGETLKTHVRLGGAWEEKPVMVRQSGLWTEKPVEPI
jgi:hypothetical protein